ncbi:cilia- and flagella-associated protein 46 isoform X1 [Leucoraja erinacea]|uniref:cilia- and flagella-associated protein 46 isoform X1 n=1 Tax=Leucoraja erinaceus TaxID=7782 RepID=UPI00245478E6|nr:cilia- and flagella-associated protein 46 isoform X1 [Leucoraja erinacea]
MDASIRQLLAAAALCDSDLNTLKEAYNLIKLATAERSVAGGMEIISADLYVQCAELALQFKQEDISQHCLTMYFEGACPFNQFLGRACLCQAQLYAPKSTENTNDLNKAVRYILETIKNARKESRYYFLIYNASVIYWSIIRQFLKPGFFTYVISSLSEVIKALEAAEDLDYEWRAQLMITLIQCYLDDGRVQDAIPFSNSAASFIQMKVPHMYPKLFSIQVLHSLVDFNKVSKEVKESIYLMAIFKMQRIKSKLKVKDVSQNLAVQLNQVYQLVRSRETSESRTQTSTAQSTAQLTEHERLSLLLELAHFALEVKHSEIAADCINDLKMRELKDKATAMEIECLESELEIQRLGKKAEKCTKSFVEHSVRIIKRLDQILQNAVREGNGSLIETICVTQWSLCLPLLETNLRKLVYKPLVNLATTLHDLDSLLIKLRCQVHMEIAQIEEDENRIEVAMEHLQKAFYLNNAGQYKNYIKQTLHRLQLYSSVYASPKLPEDQAILFIEQVKRFNDLKCDQNNRSLMIKAGEALARSSFRKVLDSENEAKVFVGHGNTGLIGLLAAKVQNYRNCMQQTEGHLERLAEVNDKLRVGLWTDLVKVARKQEVWDVCRVASEYCLLYDDGRWKPEKCDDEMLTGMSEASLFTVERISSAMLHSTRKVFYSCIDVIRLLADVYFIKGEATIQLLRSEGAEFNNVAVFPEEKLHSQGFVAKNLEESPEWITYRNWIDSLSAGATENFLRGAELGVLLNEAIIVCNAAIYIWNYNHHLLVSGRYAELVKPFQALLAALKITGHSGETVLLVMLCNGLCRGLIQPWIPNPTNFEKSESSKGSPYTAKKKPSAKKNEKLNIPLVLSVDSEGIPHLYEALQICEYAMHIINGSEPSDVVPIAVRHQIIITWVKIKQLLQQQIGPSLGSDDEISSEKESDTGEAQESNDSQSSMVQVLVALEMFSCNRNRLMKFTVPSLLELENKISSCIWTDKLLELEVWTRLLHLAYLNNDNPLVMQCAQKAFALEKLVAKSPGFKKHGKHNYTVQNELLSVVACIQGQSLVKTGAGNSKMRLAAIKAFQMSASYGEKAGSMNLVMNSAKYFWNSCLHLIPSVRERRILEEPLKAFLKAIHSTYTKNKKEEEKNEKNETIERQIFKRQIHYTISEQLSKAGNDPEEDLKLRAAMYGLLFHINTNKGDWKAGLKVLDNAIREMPKTKQRLLLFKHRIMVNTRLGQNIQMDMQKLNDESEDQVSYMWHRVVVFSKDTANKLACYQNSIGALKKPESNWQKIQELIEFGEWLYCSGFSITDALCQLDWAVDILLSMELWINPKEDEEEHSRKENILKSEAFIPEKRQLLIGAQSIDTKLTLADLQDVKQLDTLVIVQTIMATIAGHTSTHHHYLMAYAYVMCIWRVSLAAAWLFIKESTVPPPSKTARPDTGTKSNKSKGKKESTTDGRDKSKSNIPPVTVPTTLEEWAMYVCPSEVKEAFKKGSSNCLINKNNILKPTYSLFYMDLLVKELQSLSYTHLTLPILQLEELIASEILDNKSLSDLYHLRIAQICLELNLTQAAQYHEKIPGSVFIYDTERAKCREAIARMKDLQLGSSHESLLTSHGNAAVAQTASNSELTMHMSSPVLTRKRLSGVSVVDVWINKAEVLLHLGFYQPARALLSEAHKDAKELEKEDSLAKIFYLLAVLANYERNFGQAKLLLEKAQSIGGNEYFWYDVITCLVNAILGENLKDSKEQACRILQQGISRFKTASEETPNRASVIEFMITSMEARLTSIEIESLKALGNTRLKKPEMIEKLVSTCAKLEHYSNIMMTQHGYREESVDLMKEHVGILTLIAKCSEENEIKYSWLLDAYALIQKAILIEEDALCDLMSLLPLRTMTGLTLPLMRKLTSLKLIFVQLMLDMIEMVTLNDKIEAEAAKGKGLLQLIVEEFVSSTPDYTPIEKEWVTIARSLGQKAFSQLHSAHSLCSGSEELRAKCLYLTGKCLRLLAVQKDPINPGFVWVQETLGNKNGQSKEVKSREGNEKAVSNYDQTDLQLTTRGENEHIESENEHVGAQLSAQQLAKCVAIATQIKKERTSAQVYLAHASEVLLQSMNQALHSNLKDILAEASFNMVQCFGQFDPVSAGQYLALHQSCRTSIMLKGALIKTGYDTSSSQLIALLHLQQKLEKDGTMKNMLRTVNTRLSTHFKAWKNIIIQPQHLSFLSEFPSNFNIIVLQHYEDGSMLYAALLEKPKQKANVERKGKGNQSPGPTQAKIVRGPVNPQLLSSLIAKISNYKNSLAQNLLKHEYQCDRIMQRMELSQQLHEKEVAEKRTTLTAKYKNELDEDFTGIIESMEEYLNPVLSQFDFTFAPPPTPLAAGMESGKSKRKKKEEKPGGEKSTSGQSHDLGEFVIFLADDLLMKLPLEALKVLQNDVITSVSRDFSLQLLYNRQHRDEPETATSAKSPKGTTSQKKNIKMPPVDQMLPPNFFPVNTHNFRYIVDPYDDNCVLGSCPVKIMTEILEIYNARFTGHWSGVLGNKHVPSHAKWEELLKSCSAFIFYGKEHFLANLLASKLVSMNFSECQLVILLDLVQSSESFRRQSILDRPKSALQLSTEGQMDTVILLSLTGVRSIMLNQWPSTLQENALKFKKLSKNLLEFGKSTGQVILEIAKSGRSNASKSDTEISVDPSIKGSASKHFKDEARKHYQEERMTQESAFNFILYGLPNLIVT